MGKLRVYELAKELDMESKDLVKRLIEGGMDIKNYMSTLDEDAIERAKKIVSGKISEIVEEKRIRPTVIRRRRRKIEIEKRPIPERVESKEEEKREKEELKIERAAEKKAKETPIAPKLPKEAILKEEKIEKKEEVRSPREEKVEKKEESVKRPRFKKRRFKKRRTERPARIIKRPEEVAIKPEPPKEGIEEKIEEKREEKIPEKVLEKVVEPLEFREEEIFEEKEISKKKKLSELEASATCQEAEDLELEEERPRRSIRHKKIEVFEKADLYEGRAIKRKDKKASKKAKDKEKKEPERPPTPVRPVKRKIKIGETVTVSELAKAMGVKANEVIMKLMSMGVMATLNQSIDFETATLIADEFGHEVEVETITIEDLIGEEEDRVEDLKPRPPVVTIMGHVDHGKTSLLDYIRKSKIVEAESGGITQHIGAYYVERKGGDIVFLDTPGHEAFTAMRARGAKVTDIIVLVVAADDGVMPQTVEAINHAKAANIPIVVAVNKIDKPDADPEKVRRQLSDLGLIPEEWGGDTIFADISAKTGQGVDELLELIQLQAEMLELKANPDRMARGTIIEAKLDPNRGPVATVLIRNGTLHQGDHVVCGEYHGRIRSMVNSLGRRVKSAGPSVPVEIYGINGVPQAGEELIVVENEKKAKQIVEIKKREAQIRADVHKKVISLEDLFERIKEGEIKELNLIIKADVQGSIEALIEALGKLGTDQVKVRIIHSATGAISESDVMLASASNAIIIGFNVRANPRVSEIAKKEKVDIRYYNVIYNVINDIKAALSGLLEPEYKEITIGRAEVLQIFRIPKVGTVAGCIVHEGKIERGALVRVLRDDVVIHEGKIASLKRFKEDVREVSKGYECGVGVENFQDIKPGDILEIYQLEKITPEL